MFRPVIVNGSGARHLIRALLFLAVYAMAMGSGNAARAAGTQAPAPGLPNFVLKAVPAPLPVAQFQDAAGNLHDLTEFAGKVVLVNFWATWCVPCRTEMPSLDRLQQAMGGKDFTVMTISLDRAGYVKAAAFLVEIGVKNLPVYVDPSLRAARKLGVAGLPVTLLLNRKGDEIGRLTGPAEWDSAEAMGFIAQYVEKR